VRRRLEPRVADSHVDRDAECGKPEEDMEQRHHLQDFDELLQARIDESDECEDTGYGKHGSTT
jgi:hypothetical protein